MAPFLCALGSRLRGKDSGQVEVTLACHLHEESAPAKAWGGDPCWGDKQGARFPPSR